MEKTIKLFELLQQKNHLLYDIHTSDTSHVNVEQFGESILGGGSKKLKEVISNLYGLDSDRLFVIEGGCSNANFHIFYSLVENGDEILVEEPCYEPLKVIPQIFGAKILRFNRDYENKFQPKIKEIENKITNKTKIVVLTNFHNPSGVKLEDKIIKELIELAEKNKIYLFFNEIYGEPFIKKDITPIATLTDYGISSYGLSKRYGLSTLRFGLVAGNKEIIDKINKACYTTYVVNSGLLDKEWVNFFEKDIYGLHKRSEEIIHKNFDLLKNFVNSRNDISWIEPQKTTVSMLKLNNVNNLDNFINYLIKDYKIDVGQGIKYNGSNFIRIGLGINNNLFEEGIKRFEKALNSYKN